MTTEDAAHLIPAVDRLRRSRRLWRVLFFISLIAVAAALVGRFAFADRPGGDYIARIDVSGTITTDRGRRETLERLGEDDTVKAVIVSINSPGGTTAGGEELFEALAVLRGKKPVVTVVNELAASAAYMTAVGADRIFVRRLSIIGSIGVLYQHVDAGRLLQTIGIDLDKVATGPLKAEPALDGPMRPDVRVSLQELVNDSYQWFVDIVAERRGLERDAVLALADGRIVTGRVGIASGLADAVGGEPEALAWLESEREVAKDLPIHSVYPLPRGPFDDLGRWLGGEARAALGLPVDAGSIALDGLVSLWQVGPAM